MSDRLVRKIRKDSEGHVVALCSPNDDWSPRLKEDVIRDIESGGHRYYIARGVHRLWLYVVDDRQGKRLHTVRHGTGRNALRWLPEE